MADTESGSIVAMDGVICPFHLAVLNPANAEVAAAPPPARVGERNRLSLLYRHARFHVGFSRPKAVAAAMLGILGGRKWRGVLRNLVTLTYDPAELVDSPINKEPQNSGMVTRHPGGGFSEPHLDRLLDQFGAEYTPAGGGPPERGVALEGLNRFLDAVAAESNRSPRAQRIGRALAGAEVPTLLKVWPTASESGIDYLAEATLRRLFEHHEFPPLRG